MCVRLELTCIYPQSGDPRRNRRRKAQIIDESPQSADSGDFESAPFLDEGLVVDILSPHFQLTEIPNQVAPSIAMPEFSLSSALVLDDTNSTASMVSRLQVNYKDISPTYLQLFTYFCDTQSQLMSVSPQNKFKTVFAMMAIDHEPILYALLSWAAFHKSEAGQIESDNLGHTLLGKAITLVNRPGVYPFAVELATLVIIATSHICAGDDLNWRVYMEFTADLIKETGLDGFDWNDEQVYWPLKMFTYLDILAYGNRKRTLLLPKEIHDRILTYKNDELPDSLCASCHPVFMILAAINESYGEMHDGSITIEGLSERASELLEKLKLVAPDNELLLPLTYMDAQDQINLFNVFRQLAIISVHNLLLRMNAACLPMQILNNEMIRLLGSVVGTKGEAALVFPFFLAGVTASRLETRTQVLTWLTEMHERHSQRNITGATTLLREVWARDEQGTRYIDWNHLAELKGWNMNFG